MEQTAQRKIATLRERLKESAVEQMLDAAQQVMIQKGFEGATMQDIAGAAGCAAGTFYLHFKSKEALFDAITTRHARAMFAAADQQMQSTDDPLERIRLGLEAHIHYIRKNKDFFRLFFQLNPFRRLEQRIAGEARQLHAAYHAAEMEQLRQAQRQGLIRKDMSCETLQGYLDSACLFLVDDFVQPGSKMNAEELIRMIWGLLMGGLKGSVKDGK